MASCVFVQMGITPPWWVYLAALGEFKMWASFALLGRRRNMEGAETISQGWVT